MRMRARVTGTKKKTFQDLACRAVRVRLNICVVHLVADDNSDADDGPPHPGIVCVPPKPKHAHLIQPKKMWPWPRSKSEINTHPAPSQFGRQSGSIAALTGHNL